MRHATGTPRSRKQGTSEAHCEGLAIISWAVIVLRVAEARKMVAGREKNRLTTGDPGEHYVGIT